PDHAQEPTRPGNRQMSVGSRSDTGSDPTESHYCSKPWPNPPLPDLPNLPQLLPVCQQGNPALSVIVSNPYKCTAAKIKSRDSSRTLKNCTNLSEKAVPKDVMRQWKGRINSSRT